MTGQSHAAPKVGIESQCPSRWKMRLTVVGSSRPCRNSRESLEQSAPRPAHLAHDQSKHVFESVVNQSDIEH